MDTKTENKIVRDARGRARRMARSGGQTYQQCLDTIAQAEGHAHWKTFMAAHPTQDGEAAPTTQHLPASSRPDVGAMVRQRWLAGFTGEIRYERDAELTQAFLQTPAMSKSTTITHRLRTLVPGIVAAAVAGAIVAQAVVRDGATATMYAQCTVAFAVFAPLAAAVLGLAVGALVGEHPGARHLRVRCRSLFAGLQFCLFLYGYVGLVAGHQTRLVYLYGDTTSAQIVVRTVAGIVLCNLLGRIAVRSLIMGGSMCSQAPKANA